MKAIPYFNQAFGEVIRKHRKRLKLAQIKIAFGIDSSEGTIRRFERGLQTPSAPTIFLIAETLQLDPYKLLKEIMNQVSYLTDKNKTEE